jgi:unsaturated chondroitin disaccharide hydrolase
MTPNTRLILLSLLATFLTQMSVGQTTFEPREVLKVAEAHLHNATKEQRYTFVYPRSTNPDGTIKNVESRDWTSGFFVGNLWQMYAHTRDKKWLVEAKKWNVGLEKERFNTRTHDLGFMLFCSFGIGYELTGDTAYRDVLIQGAKSLSTRFNKRCGVIKSWDHGKWQFPVIIDNMMNLELLFWATRATGDSSFYNIAVTHANTTMRHHFRSDYSSYHVVDYDTAKGTALAKVTHQGASDESAWTRGQAWGLYGFVVAYRETKDPRYLDQAKRIARFILSHPNLPGNKIPYWDLNAPHIPKEERDASAAAILASALLELSKHVENGNIYSSPARQILMTLATSDYLAQPGTNNNFILKHSVGHKPGNSEIDVPLIYADYYFIEALRRYISAPK